MKKVVAIVIISILIIYYGPSVYQILMCRHSFDYERRKEYEWIFNQKGVSEIENGVSFVKEDEICTFFRLHNQTKVFIWEFIELSNLEIDNVCFADSVDLSQTKITSGEMFFKKSPISISYDFEAKFDKEFRVTTCKKSKIDTFFEQENYKGFSGYLKKISLGNRENQNQIIIHQKQMNQPAVFVVTKLKERFFAILIYSEKANEETIKQLLLL